MAHTRLVDEIESRVLGALMEKSQTTPDYYPMTVNAVIGACNQKSNRDPVMALTETQVVEALDRLRKDVLVWKVDGSRVEKYEHRLTSRWHLTSPTRALMTMLLLRGPQTPGELRARTDRLHSFADAAELERVLGEMAIGDNPLVKELPREPGKRERRWVHLMGTNSEELLASATQAASQAPATSYAARAPHAAAAGRLDPVAERVTVLEREVQDLATRLAALESQLL